MILQYYMPYEQLVIKSYLTDFTITECISPPLGGLGGKKALSVITGDWGVETKGKKIKMFYFSTFLKYSTVFANPVSASTFGAQFNVTLASVMSGLRCLGSSWGSGR
jgi:hypothetical protein